MNNKVPNNNQQNFDNWTKLPVEDSKQGQEQTQTQLAMATIIRELSPLC